MEASKGGEGQDRRGEGGEGGGQRLGRQIQ